MKHTIKVFLSIIFIVAQTCWARDVFLITLHTQMESVSSVLRGGNWDTMEKRAHVSARPGWHTLAHRTQLRLFMQLLTLPTLLFTTHCYKYHRHALLLLWTVEECNWVHYSSTVLKYNFEATALTALVTFQIMYHVSQKVIILNLNVCDKLGVFVRKFSFF